MDNGITVPHAKTNVVTRPSLAVLRLSSPVQYNAEDDAQAAEDASGKDSFGRTLYKNLMNGVSHLLPFVVGGGIMIALAFLLDDYTIDSSNFGMNTPVAAFFKTVGSAAFGYMLPILSAFIAMSIADRPGLAVGLAGGVLAMNGTNFAGIAAGETTGVSGGFLAALLAGFAAGYIVELLKKITEKLPASLNGIRPMLIYPLGGMLILGAVMCGINPVMGMINTAMTDCLNAMGLCFVTEGAIPYAAADPLRAPHGGIFVFPVVDHAVLYCVALAVGSVLGAVILSLLKKNRTDAE